MDKLLSEKRLLRHPEEDSPTDKTDQLTLLAVDGITNKLYTYTIL